MVVGDGGFQMTMCELATVVQEELDINIAIINNGYLGMVRQWQEFFYDKRYAATPISGPNFAKLAEAFGIAAATVTQRGEVAGAVEAARRQKRAARDRFPGRAGRLGLPDGAGRRRPAQDDPPAVADRGNRSGLRMPRRHEATKTTKVDLRDSWLRDFVSSNELMLHTFAVYVDNKPGVLNRVASLFRRRAFNIESLTVGHTETPGISRMTVVVDTDEYGARRLEAHLYKLVPVPPRRQHHDARRRSRATWR